MRTPNTKNTQKLQTKKYKWFTLVELIVVITILVILGTIAFTSLQGFSGSARDSSRVSDLTNLSKGLDISYIKTSSYPTPDNSFSVTYSGGVVWYQGTIGEGVMNIISAAGAKMNKKPMDPLSTAKEYTYSKLFYGSAYQIKTDWEGDSVAYNQTLFSIPEVQAASGNPTLVYIKGNYNGMVAKTQTGSTIYYLLAVPGLFLNTGSGTVVLPTTATGFYIHGQTNSGGILFTGSVIYSSGSLPSNDTEKTLFASGLALAYSGTSLANQSNISSFITALSSNNTGSLASLGGGLLSSSLGGGAGSSSTQQQTPPTPTTVNGSCGTASKTYSPTDTVYGSDTFCTTGTPLPTTPGFPTEWSPVNWTCVWGGSPLGTTDNCTAAKTATPINGSCGTANNTATVTAPTGQLCTTGNETVVATNPGTFAWDCTWVNLGTTANCSAPRQFTVTFNSNGGNAIANQTVTYNGTATTPAAPTKAWNTFAGWYSDAWLTVSYSFASAVTGDRTLYAKWAVAFTCGTSTVTGRSPDVTVYQTVTGADGKCWLKSNLGTANVATSSADSTAYGWLYQWGRLTDGHQITTSALATTQSAGDNPGNASFIKGFSDWRSTQNDTLSTTWGGTNGTSSPCPTDWRLPAQGEWAALVTAAGITNSATAFSSSLKLTVAGSRYYLDGVLYNQGAFGYYWSSSPTTTHAYSLSFVTLAVDPANNGNGLRATGFSVRCLKN